jgi:hypothetical protein
MQSNKVVTSACCLIPPDDLWGQIQEIRQKHDKSFDRWPPHIKCVRLVPFLCFFSEMLPCPMSGQAVDRHILTEYYL